MSQLKNPLRQMLDFLCQEPLIPFAICGGLLFAVYGFLSPAEKPVITIEPQTIQALENMEVELRGRPLTESEKQSLVETYIEDEVLMREAFRRELEKKDSRVRRRLLSVMRSAMDEPVAEPSATQLQKYYQEKTGVSDQGQALTFDQVFFSFGSEPPDAGSFLSSLRQGKRSHVDLGEFHQLGASIKELPEQQLRRILGAQFTTTLMAQQAGVWNGPIESPMGLHFVRLNLKNRIRRASFEQMEDYLRQEWMFNKRRDVQTRKIAELRKQYSIVIGN